MTLKTNQFNLANSRYDEDKIKKKLIKREDIDLFIFLKDIFGDNGITVLLICKINHHLKRSFYRYFFIKLQSIWKKN